jgi:glycosyltransferase involved in cell wall biosynthesis
MLMNKRRSQFAKGRNIKMAEKKIRLVLFFTRGVSLQKWDQIGMLSREVALYRRLAQEGVAVTFITFGNVADMEYARRLPGIEICCNRWGLPDKWYRLLLPLLHAPALRRADLIKTNQMQGAELALRCARLWRKRLISRCGYLWSDFTARQYGTDSPQALSCLMIEKKVFRSSCAIVLTTAAMRSNILARDPSLKEKITIIPNYVNTDLFSPNPKKNSESPHRLCYVGRLEQKQKNLMPLYKAIKNMDVAVDLVGNGPLLKVFQQKAAARKGLNVLGNLPHERLPEVLQRATAFVLPSLYEGHPKALLEAMACGLPVIASDVPGINDVVRHSETGWLCRPDTESLREAIGTVLKDANLRQRLSENASGFVQEHFALKRVVHQERNLYHTLLRDKA